MNGYENGGRGIPGFWAFLRERYTILLKRRAGQAWPWTDDPVLRAWRFCCVHREDDRVTEWFREEIRDPLRDDPEVLFATIAFRWFNTIAAGNLLKPWLLRPDLMSGGWDREGVQCELEGLMDEGVKVFTGAYMINSAPGKPKHIDVLDNLDWCLQHFYRVHPCATKEAAFKSLLAVPRLGNFAAYQVIVDLQYTYLLEHAPDLNTFTVAGPGCAKGLGLMVADDPTWFSYSSKADQVKMLKVMRDVREAGVEDPALWPREWPTLPLSDVENGFCEYSKWRTGHAGGRLKRRYKA